MHSTRSEAREPWLNVEVNVSMSQLTDRECNSRWQVYDECDWQLQKPETYVHTPKAK